MVIIHSFLGIRHAGVKPTDQLSGLFRLYTDDRYLLLEIKNGFAIEAMLEAPENTDFGVDMGWKEISL